MPFTKTVFGLAAALLATTASAAGQGKYDIFLTSGGVFNSSTTTKGPHPEAVVYKLVHTYDQSNFFSGFNFYTGGDPTYGDVQYVGQSQANSGGLIGTSNGGVYLGVDYKTVNPPSGRQSVRLQSNAAYTHGLFIIDLQHMPAADCGAWPAWWTFGPNWPNNGEIDVIEGVNLDTTNDITLHTSAGCTVNIANSQGGTNLGSNNCNAGNANTGCGATTSNSNNYGNGFNSVGGGVYAMQWESSGIYVWWWPRNQIPGNINNPDLTTWGTPLVSFNGCNIDAHFASHNIIFDTTFCGAWAGAVWGNQCSGATGVGDCATYVNQHPGAFANAYWLINYVKVFQL